MREPLNRSFARRLVAAAAVVQAALGAGAVLAAEGHCTDPAKAIGVARVVEIDTSGAPIYGAVTKFVKQESFLRPKEVVLTFDDGPAPAVTRQVLATLDAFCTKATFFSVGRMAIAYPDTVKEELARGHTVGSHTWSHPLTLSRLKSEAAQEEIERGFAAVALAAGRPIAPFFRFPGLGDSQKLLTYLQSRKIATFTVDVISNDSFISSTDKLIKTTLERVEQRQGGIILFHDIKPQTAKALPVVLAELKSRGYSVVHMRAKQGYEPDLSYTAALQPLLSKKPHRGEVFAGDAAREQSGALAEAEEAAPVTVLAPAAKPIVLASRHAIEVTHAAASARRTHSDGGWITTVRKVRPGTIAN